MNNIRICVYKYIIIINKLINKSLFTTRVIQIKVEKIQLQQYTLKSKITIFIKFRFYTTLNMKHIMKFSQIIQILYLFIIIPIQK